MEAEFCFFSYFFYRSVQKCTNVAQGFVNPSTTTQNPQGIAFIFISFRILFSSYFDSIQETWIEINQENWCAASVATRVAIFAFLVVIALFMR